MKLTDAKIKNSRPKEKPYAIQDGNGLYLEIRPSGGKFWRYRFWLTPKKDGRYTIGQYPAVSLAEARKQREWAREQVKAGISPMEAKIRQEEAANSESINTFKFVAEEWMKKKWPTWRQASASQTKNLLNLHVFPAFGNRQIKEITSADILALLHKMEAGGAKSSAIKVRQWCSTIFCYAVATLRADGDPAAPLKGAIIADKTEHSRALSEAELREFFVRLTSFRGMRVTGIMLRLLMLVFVRQGELRNAEWSEIDVKKKIWIIPKEKMKKDRPHSVPLSAPALALIEELKGLTGDGRYLFPNTRDPDRVMSDTTINRAIEYLGYAPKTITAHDFRATASTHLHELGYRPEVIERQLAHVEQNQVAAAYNHAEYLPERIELMNGWADWLAALMPHAPEKDD